MSIKKFPVRRVSYGLYTRWDAKSKELPELVKYTTSIPAELGVEFGYIVNIKKARREILEYEILHPDFLDTHGDPAPPFLGEVRIPSNDYLFFIGDTLWEPLHDKLGNWQLTLRIRGVVIAEETFEIVDPAAAESNTLTQVD